VPLQEAFFTVGGRHDQLKLVRRARAATSSTLLWSVLLSQS